MTVVAQTYILINAMRSLKKVSVYVDVLLKDFFEFFGSLLYLSLLADRGTRLLTCVCLITELTENDQMLCLLPINEHSLISSGSS